MRLNRLTIYGFGKFHDRTFQLTAGLNVLLGPNEAGKSTLTQFISAIFFGFPTKKHPELRYEPLDGSRFGGEIAFTLAGTDYLLSRVDGPRGGKVTLRNTTLDLTLPAATLPRLMAPVDAQLFKNVYAMNEPQLGTVFAASKQELVDRLRHVGAVGSDFWLHQARQLDRAADEVYKPQGRKPALNQLLQEHAELTAKLEKANAGYASYWDLLQRQQQRRQQQTDLQRQLAVQRQIAGQYDRQLALWPVYQQWRKLAATPESTHRGFQQRDATALERLTNQAKATRASQQADQDQLAGLQEQQQLDPLFQDYLLVSAQVDPLIVQLPDITIAERERQRLQTDQADLQRRASEIEQQYATHGQMPRAFSLVTTQQVRQLTSNLSLATQKRRRLQQQLNQLNERYRQQQPTRQQRKNPLADKQIGWLAAGLIVLVGSMFLPATLFKLAGALLGVAVGYYGVFIVDSSTPASRQQQSLEDDIRDVQAQLRETSQVIEQVTRQLDDIGDAHGLGDISVDQWAAAQTAIVTWDRLTQRLEAGTAQLATATQTVTDFKAAIQRVLPRMTVTNMGDLTTQLKDLQVTQQRLQSQESDVAAIAARLKRDQLAVDRAQQAVTTFLQTRNVRSTDAFYRQYQQVREQGNRLSQRDALAQQMGDQQLAALQRVTDRATLVQQATTATSQVTKFQRQLDTVTEALATGAGQLVHLTASGTQATLRQQLANLETRMQALTQDWLVDRLVSQWIAATLAAASGDRLPQIVKTASQFYDKLTENRYTEIELTPTTLRVRRTDGAWRLVSQLSRGTAEQLDLAVKLAFAVVMAERVAMPVVIDDGFVNFDDQRRRAAYRLLATISADVQVILLTADPVVTDELTTENLIRLTD
ncbi:MULTISPECIES: AAA family ATPase [Lactobacillaceae]|uniref:ATP-binding protein n=1 Tax=Lactobacillaceae TaxID=33958 RepID=UPI0014564530|nr:AAA family ATPase [Lactobacillus sp. HBUAS51381]NLR09908.1 AAA family ATPase [Lactobacillus sp. HBUAS51381]